MSTYYVGANLYSDNYLAHYGIKGMKWGVRRYQNEDGSLTAAGKKRYLNSDGTLNKRGQKAQIKMRNIQAKQEYRNKKRDISRRRAEMDERFDKQKQENIWGLNGGVGDRMRFHMENEYKRSKADNKLDQERLNALREYRQKIGKKKVDTWFMKNYQKTIDEIANESQSEFNERFITDFIANAAYGLSWYDLD